LITGGATGIGFALAQVFVQANNEVIICGRRGDKLKEAKNKLPQLNIRVCDVASGKDRESLYKWVDTSFGNINVLVNNAGIQRMIDFRRDDTDVLGFDNEVKINLLAPIHLSADFIPRFLKREESAIVNISSGLAFIPLAIVPVYCATKAAIHSLTMSLRHQLRDTKIRVFEIIPPTVDTELDKGAREKRGQADRGIPPMEVAIATLHALENDEYELGIGMAQNLKMGARNDPEQTFSRINR
jgi:uncharacterized oxidoreductase